MNHIKKFLIIAISIVLGLQNLQVYAEAVEDNDVEIVTEDTYNRSPHHL